MNRFLVAVLFLSLANAYPSGAPLDACDTLEPNHGVTANEKPSPYNFFALNNGDGTFQLSVEKTDTASPDFKGFIVQARAEGSTSSMGSFVDVPTDAHTLDCSGQADTATHSTNETRSSIRFKWSSRGAPVSGVFFRGAVVQTKTTYWAGLSSLDLGTIPFP